VLPAVEGEANGRVYVSSLRVALLGQDGLRKRVRIENIFRSHGKPPNKEEIKDEPGADDRFLRGMRQAVNTPPKPFTKPLTPKPKGKKETPGG